MITNLFKLNSKKTELMVVAPKALFQKVCDFLLQVDGCSISQSIDLGFILDSTFSYESHIKSVTKSTFCYLKNISRLRPFLCC